MIAASLLFLSSPPTTTKLREKKVRRFQYLNACVSLVVGETAGLSKNSFEKYLLSLHKTCFHLSIPGLISPSRCATTKLRAFSAPAVIFASPAIFPAVVVVRQ